MTVKKRLIGRFFTQVCNKPPDFLTIKRREGVRHLWPNLVDPEHLKATVLTGK